MAKIEIVSEVRVNGVWYRQEELDPAEFQQMLNEKNTRVMKSIGFERKTA